VALPYLFAVTIAIDMVFVLVGGPAMLRPKLPPGAAVAEVYLPVFLVTALLGFAAGKLLLLPWLRRNRGGYEAALLDTVDLNSGFDLSDMDSSLDVRPLLAGDDDSDNDIVNDISDISDPETASLQSLSDVSLGASTETTPETEETAAATSGQAGFGPCEIFFAPLTVTSACAVAFAHGGNDVANVRLYIDP
jgi:phosphate/sulfate permease